MTDAEKVAKIREILDKVKPQQKRGSTYYLRMLYLEDVVHAIRMAVR